MSNTKNFKFLHYLWIADRQSTAPDTVRSYLLLLENVMWIAMVVETNSSHQGVLGYCLDIAHVLLGHCLGVAGVLLGYYLGMLGFA